MMTPMMISKSQHKIFLDVLDSVTGISFSFSALEMLEGGTKNCFVFNRTVHHRSGDTEESTRTEKQTPGHAHQSYLSTWTNGQNANG